LANTRTTVTELITGLGTLGFDSVEEALAARPPEMVSVSPETWELLERAHDGGALRVDFEEAWANGIAFSHAANGLRGRRPILIEWKGSQRAPGDEVAPIDLRIDHVYLVSCKYLSKIMINASPGFLFERLLQGAHGIRGGDWYAAVAPDEYHQLYATVIAELGWRDLPTRAGDLDRAQRRRLAQALSDGWPGQSRHLYENLGNVVAHSTAQRWQDRLATRHESEAMLWRVLRMGSAPYFVLGTSPSGPLRVRVASPWDWRLQFRLRRFVCSAQAGGQARVGWTATVEDRNSAELHDISGHVEVRWSHGRFSGNPEAKVYLDTPHSEIPGYFPLL
jgi:hypothetical protein